MLNPKGEGEEWRGEKKIGRKKENPGIKLPRNIGYFYKINKYKNSKV